MYRFSLLTVLLPIRNENLIEFQWGNHRVRVYDRLIFFFLQFLFFVFDEKSGGNEKNLDSAGNLCNRSGRAQVRRMEEGGTTCVCVCVCV